jgi:hypothetical protein
VEEHRIAARMNEGRGIFKYPSKGKRGNLRYVGYKSLESKWYQCLNPLPGWTGGRVTGLAGRLRLRGRRLGQLLSINWLPIGEITGTLPHHRALPCFPAFFCWPF